MRFVMQIWMQLIKLLHLMVQVISANDLYRKYTRFSFVEND